MFELHSSNEVNDKNEAEQRKTNIWKLSASYTCLIAFKTKKIRKSFGKVGEKSVDSEFNESFVLVGVVLPVVPVQVDRFVAECESVKSKPLIFDLKIKVGFIAEHFWMKICCLN